MGSLIIYIIYCRLRAKGCTEVSQGRIDGWSLPCSLLSIVSRDQELVARFLEDEGESDTDEEEIAARSFREYLGESDTN